MFFPSEADGNQKGTPLMLAGAGWSLFLYLDPDPDPNLDPDPDPNPNPNTNPNPNLPLTLTLTRILAPIPTSKCRNGSPAKQNNLFKARHSRF